MRRPDDAITTPQQTSEEEVRHVSRNSDTDIVSLPWRGGRPGGASAIGRAHHRTGGARHRGRRLCLFLLHHVDGRFPQAIHQRRTRQGSLQGPDEHVRQRARIPAGRFQGCRALQLRHVVFRLMAGHDQGARRHLGSGYRWTLLPAADARHVDRCLCVAGLADDGHQGRDIPDNARRAGGRICATGLPRSSSFQRTRSGSKRQRPMSGSLAAPRRTARRITLRFTRSRPATRSPCFQNLARRRSRSRSRSTQAST